MLADENGLDEDRPLRRTVDAMKAGIEAIAQADLKVAPRRGRADILMRVDRPSHFARWSYEVIDTKLARVTRGVTILQLCLYSELLAEFQGVIPDRMHVVTPGNGFQPEAFRVHDFLAYYRFVKSRLENAVSSVEIFATYPEPVEHCEICQWCRYGGDPGFARASQCHADGKVLRASGAEQSYFSGSASPQKGRFITQIITQNEKCTFWGH
jgi:uncharacterized protein